MNVLFIISTDESETVGERRDSEAPAIAKGSVHRTALRVIPDLM